MTNPDSFSVRVYYEDTDFSGNVYHAAYLKFMERARSEFLRQRQVHHTQLAKQGLAFAVRHIDIWYDCSAHIDDCLQIVTLVEKISGARLKLRQTIMRGERILVRAGVEVVAISLSGRARRLPKELVAALKNDAIDNHD
ncbi:Tol-Pal system-associated acyl-CoA thioesterase [hydrothermal vent metagenome]|uniref:Tol-Pal system-associated acyl-CoA thioesterase n=1 Tax=hydrothermal vent metagenome TaxID=652676 RepID=A0A3B0THT0_9ZZZZ